LIGTLDADSEIPALFGFPCEERVSDSPCFIYLHDLLKMLHGHFAIVDQIEELVTSPNQHKMKEYNWDEFVNEFVLDPEEGDLDLPPQTLLPQ